MIICKITPDELRAFHPELRRSLIPERLYPASATNAATPICLIFRILETLRRGGGTRLYTASYKQILKYLAKILFPKQSLAATMQKCCCGLFILYKLRITIISKLNVFIISI
ncbi:MAG: hypothetical protein LBG77_07750, partial [Dysgonamonadaceae bacterium]|nr:hypothetical protein [Dysgonamonadaceae bacterium]